MSQAIVNNFADLKTNALDPNVDIIYLSGNITIESGGILLPKNKAGLIIDGLYPQDGTGTIHSITDRLSSVSTDSIRVQATTGNYNLTLKNCIVYGRNFYGILSTENSSLNRNTVLTLENVEYSGPQAAYNRYGEVRVIDGNYNIGKYNGTTSAVHETFETNILTLSGNVSIRHDGLPNSCFLMSEANSLFTIKENAVVFVEALQREMIYCDSSTTVVLEKNSNLHAKTQHSMFYSGMAARSISIGENAEFIFDQQATYSNATVQCNGAFSAERGSRIILIKRFNSTEPLLRFGATATANFNNPLAVVFYNAGGSVIRWTTGTGTIEIQAEIINYWTTAQPLPDAGGFEDIPLYNWVKADGTDARITATLSASDTTAVTTNLQAGIDAPIIPNTSSFNVQNARVLAFGRLPVAVNEIKETNTEISGETLPKANMRMDARGSTEYSEADSAGSFIIGMTPPVEKGEIITVSVNIDFKTKRVETKASGSIYFLNVPERLPFLSTAVPIYRPVVKRTDPNWAIVVRDSRTNGGTWSVYSSAEEHMASPTAELVDALIFKDEVTVQSLEHLPILIFSGDGNADADYTDTVIRWSDVCGILLQLQQGYLYETGHYQTELSFFLQEDDPPSP